MKELTIGGVKIKFPWKPYPAQLILMDKIIRGLNAKDNCLLESPTGSGKTLALLCACLAWLLWEKVKRQAEYFRHIDNYCGITEGNPLNEILRQQAALILNRDKFLDNSIKESPRVEVESSAGVSGSVIVLDDSDTTLCDASTSVLELPETPSKAASRKSAVVKKRKKKQAIEFDSDSDDDDCVITQPLCTSTPLATNNTFKEYDLADNGGKIPKPVDVFDYNGFGCDGGKDKMAAGKDKGKPTPPRRIPKIFYGTRTHKQVAQIIRELNKTAYNNVKTCVLGSRDHYCIHPEVSRSKQKADDCNELLKNDKKNRRGSKGAIQPTCLFKERANKIRTHEDLYAQRPKQDAWDVEDLVTIGKQHRICPYFVSRSLMADADIVICPYNYLIDPYIRESMDIHLEGQIVILDEAHNIEDCSRDASSWSVTLEDLLAARSNLEHLAYNGFSSENTNYLAMTLSGMMNWIKKSEEHLSDFTKFGEAKGVYEGYPMIEALKEMGIGVDQHKKIKDAFSEMCKSEEDGGEEGSVALNRSTTFDKLSSGTVLIFKNLLNVLENMYKTDMIFAFDYRLVVTMSYRKNKKTAADSKTLTLNFWCLNPAVALSEIKSQVHSIVLTSGTLSPMQSFQSELGLPFKITAETNHVIDKSQVWVSRVGSGPSGAPINCSFKSQASLNFQDDVGALIQGICEVVPHGVLCFFPSYSILDKLSARWQMTQTWSNISRSKLIVTEPRFGDELASAMEDFYNGIRSEHNSNSRGSLMLAVCRGKISEGLDFADNYARAVITFGIPFPNVMDPQVKLKREYNDKNSRRTGVLSGSDWYEIQAFRALNQALGRCIRHKNDWGALIIVDERFLKMGDRYKNHLSKWVRSNMSEKETVEGTNIDFRSHMTSLREFVSKMVDNDSKNEQSAPSVVVDLTHDNSSETFDLNFMTSGAASSKKLKSEATSGASGSTSGSSRILPNFMVNSRKPARLGNGWLSTKR